MNLFRLGRWLGLVAFLTVYFVTLEHRIMQGVIIPENPNGYSSNVPGVLPGSIVVDPAGTTQNVGIVVRTGPTTNNLLILSGQRSALGEADIVWTPGAGGDGTLLVKVLDNGAAPIAGAEVEVTLLSGIALTSVTPALGTSTYLQGLTSTNAMIRSLVDINGQVSLAIDGTAGDTLRYTVRVIGLPQVGSVQAIGPTVVSNTVVLPA